MLGPKAISPSVGQQPPVTRPHLVGDLLGPGPLPVDGVGGVGEKRPQPLLGHVGPGLVGVARQEQPIDHGEAAVVRRQGVGRPAEVIEGGR